MEGIQSPSLDDLQAALDRAHETNGQPKCIVLRTTPGKGIPSLEQRERAHFVRVEPDEWGRLGLELEETYG